MDVSMGIRMRTGIALLLAILCWSPDASHALTVVAPDLNAGNDVTPPTVTVASPLAGAVVAGMIGYRGRYGGIVRIYVDGALATQLDTYTPEEEIAVPVYTINGLADETHSLMLELTAQKNPAALASETAVDAFDIVR